MGPTTIDTPEIFRIASGEKPKIEHQRLILAEISQIAGMHVNDWYDLSVADAERVFRAVKSVSRKWPRLYFELHGIDRDQDCGQWIAWIYMGEMKKEHAQIIYPRMGRAKIKRMAQK